MDHIWCRNPSKQQQNLTRKINSMSVNMLVKTSVFSCIPLALFTLTMPLILKCPDTTQLQSSLSRLYSFTPFFPIFCLHILSGPDHGDDDRVLPLYLHHSGNVPWLLMQIESRLFSSSHHLSFWWIVANCQWSLDPVHNINFVWQAEGIMESSVCCSKHFAL